MKHDRSFRDRKVLTVTAAAVFVPGVKRASAALGYSAIRRLHVVLSDLRSDLSARVLSAVDGAVLIVSDEANSYVHHGIGRIADACADRGLAVRIGVSHGDVEVLRDADAKLNFIGTPINTAARLAASVENAGCLYDAEYTNFARAVPRIEGERLHPSALEERQIRGKPHDAPFTCRASTASELLVLDSSEEDHDLDKAKMVNAVAIAYDLPKFSAGDRSELSKRFRGVVDAYMAMKAEGRLASGPYFLPGGDGGIIVFPANKKSGVDAAERFAQLLLEESSGRDEGLSVVSRIGVHYGPVALYENAEQILRPTGLVCYVAEAIISDAHARTHNSPIYSDAFLDILGGGSRERLNDQFLELPLPEDGVAKEHRRFVRRPTNAPSSLLVEIEEISTTWEPE